MVEGIGNPYRDNWSGVVGVKAWLVFSLENGNRNFLIFIRCGNGDRW
jgi:hypothetical protein